MKVKNVEFLLTFFIFFVTFIKNPYICLRNREITKIVEENERNE